MENAIQTGNFHALLVFPPAITVIIICLLLGFSKWRALFWENKLIFSLVSTLVVLNVIEILTYGNLYRNYDLLIRLYYSVMFISASIILCLSANLNAREILPRKIIYIFCIVTSAISIVMLLSGNLIIQGAEIRSYSISRIPGNFYWIFQIYILICVTVGPALIWRSIATSKTSLDKKRRVVILFSFLPIFLTVLLVLALMQLGLEITWSIFLPFSTLIFVIVYLFTESKIALFRFLVNVPYTKERKAYSELNIRVLDYISKTQTDESFPLKTVMAELEQIFITNTLEIKDGNHNLAAELLSISLSTVYRHKEKADDRKRAQT